MASVNDNCSLKLTIIEASYFKDADFFGKQDPLFKFTHHGRRFQTTIKDGAGKHAVWNETFTLENMKKAQNQTLVLTSFDEDTGGVLELIGETAPMQYNKFICSQVVKHTVDLLIKGKKTGTVVFSTEFVWAEPDPPLIPRMANLNKKCWLKITIVEATFDKDAEWFGKQDPFIKWKYGGVYYQTSIKKDAGIYAQWNETFTLA